MNKLKYLIIIVIILLAACSPSDNKDSDLTIDDILKEYQTPGSGGSDQSLSDDNENSNSSNCYKDGVHPIGESIAEQFPTVTSYNEVMMWFCNGALFEDILNGLTTEEMTGIEAEATLRMIAEGFTWEEIWLELGVTNE